VRAALVAAVIAAYGLVACSSKAHPRRNTADDAIVYVRSNVRDAQVYVDGRFIAPLDAMSGGVSVEPGVHRLELRRDDYFSSYLELDLHKAERKKVSLDMAPVLP
jgi:uncharacterized protein with FMN-binding domain